MAAGREGYGEGLRECVADASFWVSEKGDSGGMVGLEAGPEAKITMLAFLVLVKG